MAGIKKFKYSGYQKTVIEKVFEGETQHYLTWTEDPGPYAKDRRRAYRRTNKQGWHDSEQEAWKARKELLEHSLLHIEHNLKMTRNELEQVEAALKEIECTTGKS